MSWEMVKLGDVCEINMGKTPSRSNPKYWGGNNPWVSIADLKGEYFITRTKENITDLGIKESGIKVVPKNTLLYSFKLSIGKIAITKNDLYTNEAIVALPIKDKDKLDLSYLYYATQKINLINVADKAVKGITLNKEKLKTLQIPLPPLSTQKRIAEILDKADALRKKDQQLLKYYDDLAQSLFIDLFGDPVKNERGWEVKKLGSIIGFPKGLVDPRIAPYSDMYHIGGDNIVSKTGELINYKPANQLNLISGKYLFDNTQLLYNKIRPYLNKVAKPNFNGICSADMYPISPNLNFANRDYLWSIMTSNSFIKFSETVARRANIPKINREELCEYLLPVPPLELQNQFATQIQNIEQQKERLKIQIQASEHLFQALLKQAFNGGLSV